MHRPQTSLSAAGRRDGLVCLPQRREQGFPKLDSDRALGAILPAGAAADDDGIRLRHQRPISLDQRPAEAVAWVIG